MFPGRGSNKYSLAVVLAALKDAGAATPPTIAGYDLLGEGWCSGDDLFRPMNFMQTTVAGSTTLAAAAPACADYCTKAATTLDRCMGFEVRSNGVCRLHDRGWTVAEKASGEAALSNISVTVVLDAGGIQSFPGQHLVRLNDDSYALSLSSYTPACYRRRISCPTGLNCTALHRYSCSLGKLANTCDSCLPYYQGPIGQNNIACTAIVRTPPTLRIAFSSGAFSNEAHGTDSGFSTALLSEAWAMKYSWENQDSFTPNPLVPPAHRQDFKIEYYGFTENYTLLTKLEVGGTEQVSPSKVQVGLRTMAGSAGGSVGSTLQLRELPPGTRAHVVIGNRLSEDNEKALMRAAGQLQVPLLSYAFTDPFTDDKTPYFIRTNRVALNAGSAIAKILQTIGYTRVTVLEQVQSPLVANKLIDIMGSTFQITVIAPPTAQQGPCNGKPLCTQFLKSTWDSIRASDARIIIHEHGGNNFEFVMLMVNDLFGDKTLYIQTGYPCSAINFFSGTGYAIANNINWMTTANITQCESCRNLIASNSVSDAARMNWTYVANFLFSPANAYQSQQTTYCPQFPTVHDLLNCSYCHGMDPFFTSPGCRDLHQRFDKAMSHSMCIEPDLSRDTTVWSSYQNYMECIRPGQCDASDATASPAATAKLKASGFPSSYLIPYEPGGRLWNAGLASSSAKGFGYTQAWTDVSMCQVLGVSCWVNLGQSNFVDAVMTAIIGYNEFVRFGGDADAATDPTSWPTSDRQGNAVANGWRDFLLGSDFEGMAGHVKYVTQGRDKGERNIVYKVFQALPGSPNGCYLKFLSANQTINNYRVIFVASSWNFKYVPMDESHSGELKLPDENNLRGCTNHLPGWFSGKVAFIERGGCSFGVKVLNAKEAGAVAMLLMNVVSDIPIRMGSDDPVNTISGVSIGDSDGRPVRDALLISNNSGGPSVSYQFEASTACIDPTYWKTKGYTAYFSTMLYDLATNSLRNISGSDVTCNGVPGSNGQSGPLTGANCSGIVFNNGYKNGTIHPPWQEPESCGVGYEYSLQLRQCNACPPGQFKHTSLLCAPCLAGRYANGTGNSACQICQSGKMSLDLAPTCTTCLAGYFSSTGSTMCASCKAGTASTSPGLSECTICNAGYYAGQAAAQCTPCPPGNFSGVGMSTCDDCEEGTYSSSTAQSACDICPEGKYAGQGASSCTLCAPGKYTSAPQQPRCYSCPVGRFSNALGANTSCIPCERGKYSAVAGNTECTRCNGSLITPGTGQQYQTDCVCTQGFYRPRNDQVGQCNPCPEGMTCATGSDMNNLYNILSLNVDPQVYNGMTTAAKETTYGVIPELDVGYVALLENPLWVYMCLGKEEICPGGLTNSCGSKMSDIACGKCAAGYHRGLKECIECTSLETSMMLFPIIPVVLGPLAIYFMYVNTQDPLALWGSPKNGLVIIAFILVFHCQTIGVISIFNLKYPPAISSTWKHLDFFAQGLTILRTDCAGIRSFEATFITNMVVPLCVAGLFLFVFVLNRLVVCCYFKEYHTDEMGRQRTISLYYVNQHSDMFSKFKSHATRPMNPNILFSCYGAVMFSFSISIASIAFSLFKCYSHPNGKDKSLVQAPDVLCYEEKWNSMIGVAVGGIAIYCLGSLAFTTWVLYQAPRRFGDLEFRQRWKFLLAKFRPEVWWWGNVTIIKGVTINLSIVAFEKGIEQVWWVSITLLVFMLLTISFLPWRHVYANVTDVLSSCCLVSSVGLASWFAPSARSDVEIDNHGRGVFIITCLPVVPFLYYCAIVGQSECNKVQLQGGRIVLGYRLRSLFQIFNDCCPAELHQFCMKITEHDVRILQGAANIITTELLGHTSFGSNKRLCKPNSGRIDKICQTDVWEQSTGRKTWKDPNGAQELSLARIQDLGQTVTEMKGRSLSRAEFEELCQTRMNLSSQESDALFQVVDINRKNRATSDDIKSLALAFNDDNVRRYKELPIEVTQISSKLSMQSEVFDVNPKDEVGASSSSRRLAEESSQSVNAPMIDWEAIRIETSGLNPHPRPSIQTMALANVPLSTPRSNVSPRRYTPRVISATTPRISSSRTPPQKITPRGS